jgi:ornithine--oxo-acid transaminase
VKGVPAERAEIIACSNNFHGRTLGIVGFSTDPDARGGFGPFAPGFRIVPFGDFDAFASAINENTVAFLVEPIQGEAGVILPPAGYFSRVRALCTERNVTLILDEIQTGLGRTGRLLAEEHEGIEADVTLIGKALSGGFYPVSAVLSNSEVLGVLKPGQHGSTFGGNPLAAAVGLETLNVLVDERLSERAAELGARLMSGLAAIASPLVQDVRGKGLLVGVEIDPARASARRVVDGLLARGVLSKDTHGTVVRFAPPLVIEPEEIELAVEALREALAEIERAS